MWVCISDNRTRHDLGDLEMSQNMPRKTEHMYSDLGNRMKKVGTHHSPSRYEQGSETQEVVRAIAGPSQSHGGQSNRGKHPTLCGHNPNLYEGPVDCR